MKLSKLQQEIVESKENKIVVIAAAACGKTRVLTERVRYWLKQNIDPLDICCITFTNAAADEMRVRLGEDYKDGMFIGTIHALAARFLSIGGYSKLVGQAINEEEFDLFFTFIQKNNCTQHYKYVLVDEAQDLSLNEYNFIFNMINPENFFVVGDYRQNIYENLKKASAEYMMQLSRQAEVVTYNLNENYRNSSNILARAKREIKKIGIVDDSIPMINGGMVYEGKFNIHTLVEWINNNGDPRDWAVLCYTNKEKQDIQYLLEKYNIDTITFNLQKKTKEQIDELMNTNSVKVLTIWGAKGLGFPNVAVYGKNWLYRKRNGNPIEACRVDYVAYTRAMQTLVIFVK